MSWRPIAPWRCSPPTTSPNRLFAFPRWRGSSSAGAGRCFTVRSDGPSELTPEDRDRLQAAGVAVDERRVAGLRGPGSALTAVDFADGSRACGGLLVPATLHQRSTLAEQLGATAGAPGPLAADAVEVDANLATTAPGVFAAGDLSSQVPSVAGAVAAGNLAAAMIVASLMTQVHGLTPAGDASP